jgi:TolB-like protein/AraC-like DNA-binding protein
MPREFIQKLTNLVETNLANEKFGPDELAKESGMSRSNLNRKLRKISDQNISQFIREVRLKKAKELLLNEDATVAEISYRVGFGSPTYFNKCFHEYFGVAPGEIRNQEPENEPEILPVETELKKFELKKILIGLIAGLIVLISALVFITNKISRSSEIIKEKSIAVLSFKYLSNEVDKQYLAHGMMDAILAHLSKIKDLRVISDTNADQYKESNKTAGEIGSEENVGYLLEGSLQKNNNQVRLILQLIRTSDESYVWSEIFDRDWKDIFSIQTEVAEAVAKQLQVVITPEELQLIHKTQTTNLTAYDYYIKGNDELERYEFKIKRDSITLRKAQHFFQKALESDSTFALAYTGLAAIKFWTSEKDFLSENYMDSVLILANRALTFDPQCAEAYYYRGYVFSQTAKTEEALKEVDKALKFNPNYWKAFYLRGYILQEFNDYVGLISNLYEAVLRNRGSGLPSFLIRFSYNLSAFGFPDLAKKYNQQALELYGDTTRYLYCLAYTEYSDENFEKAYQIAKSADKRDSNFGYLIRDNDLSIYCMITGRYEEAYSISSKFYERLNKSGIIDPRVSKKLAYYLWQTGRTKEAEFYFNQLIKYLEVSIKLGRWDGVEKRSYFDLAEVYACLGNKEKAYYYLDEVNKNQSFPWYWVILFKREPYFDPIRQEPRFQKILKDVEAKYEAEHERLRKWLLEEGLM